MKQNSTKKHQNELEDSVMYYQKEAKEVAELLQKGNTSTTRKLTRIPFYRLEKINKPLTTNEYPRNKDDMPHKLL